MSEEREPIRLRDDPTEDPGLRSMLDAASGERASDAVLDRVLAGVLAGGGGGGGSSSSGSSGAGTTTAAKIAAAIGTSVVGAGLIALVATTSMTPPPTETPHAIAPADAAQTTDAAQATDAPAPDAALAIDAGLDAFVLVHVGRRTPPPPTSVVADPETDAALMMRATREHDPTAQLALAREHRARFADSAFAEDREALIVEDLAALGRSADAESAAATFRSRWPRSAHLTHIQSALARMRAP